MSINVCIYAVSEVNTFQRIPVIEFETKYVVFCKYCLWNVNEWKAKSFLVLTEFMKIFPLTLIPLCAYSKDITHNIIMPWDLNAELHIQSVLH